MQTLEAEKLARDLGQFHDLLTAMTLFQKDFQKWKARLTDFRDKIGEWQPIIDQAREALKEIEQLTPGITSFQRRIVKKRYKDRVYESPFWTLTIPKKYHCIAEYLQGLQIEISMELSPSLAIILLRPHPDPRMESNTPELEWPPKRSHMEYYDLSRDPQKKRTGFTFLEVRTWTKAWKQRVTQARGL